MTTKTDKVMAGIACALWMGTAVGVGANIYASAESEAALTPEAKHALVLENRLNSSIPVRVLIQNPEVVNEYGAVLQEYNGLMANPEIEQSIDNSKSYTNKWYCNADVRSASMVGFIFFPAYYGVGALINHIQKKSKNKKEQKAKAK
ncbi:MAG: hypothetical protein WC852_02265 [Candidatus Nanoarchaeia archaeon]|jgi:hypothetical protein